MGLFCLTLPKTPPSKFSDNAGNGTAIKKNATLEAIGEIKHQQLITLFLLAVPINMIHQFYFVHTSDFLSELQIRQKSAQNATSAINKILNVDGDNLMTIDQMMKMLVLAMIPFFAKKISRKTLLTI